MDKALEWLRYLVQALGNTARVLEALDRIISQLADFNQRTQPATA